MTEEQPPVVKPKPLAQAKKATEVVAGGFFLRPLIRWTMGGTDWYKSLTAWGLILFYGVSGMIGDACSQGLISADLCATMQSKIETAGAVMTALGIRRAVINGRK